MFTISQSNPVEVILAIAFVVIAVAALLGTGYFFIAYIYSNIRERWKEYSNKKRFAVIRNIVVSIAVVTILIVLSATKLR